MDNDIADKKLYIGISDIQFFEQITGRKINDYQNPTTLPSPQPRFISTDKGLDESVGLVYKLIRGIKQPVYLQNLDLRKMKEELKSATIPEEESMNLLTTYPLNQYISCIDEFFTAVEIGDKDICSEKLQGIITTIYNNNLPKTNNTSQKYK